LAEFARRHLPEAALSKLVRQYHEGVLVRVIARDSTTIAGREKACDKKTEVKVKKYKRGRPRKGEIREAKETARVERQLRQSPGKSLSELDKECGWGCKSNSQGKTQYTKGYKLHLDVSDQGIPVSACVTGANVHDSQVAIPLEKMTERRVAHLCSMADSAYDFAEHRLYISQRGRAAIIDLNNRRSPEKLELGPLEREQFKARTVVERANSHLKDHLLPSALYVKGHSKVNFVLLMGVLCLAALKILQADCNPRCCRRSPPDSTART
jgi:IS5 family transposase